MGNVIVVNDLGISKINGRPMALCYCSVTRLGDLLDFGQLFKAFGNN